MGVLEYATISISLLKRLTLMVLGVAPGGLHRKTKYLLMKMIASMVLGVGPRG